MPLPQFVSYEGQFGSFRTRAGEGDAQCVVVFCPCRSALLSGFPVHVDMLAIQQKDLHGKRRLAPTSLSAFLTMSNNPTVAASFIHMHK
mmetsp:Transcript_37031/g.96014  ORF Transcript_37031/g.96014 Transcript_37031/m.96014 type:complete len:89 (-) Transcript_37031:45-311(-)